MTVMPFYQPKMVKIIVFAKAVDFFSASRKQKKYFSASTASSKEQYYMYV